MTRLLLGILVLVALTVMCSSRGKQICKRPVLSKNLFISKIRHKKRNRRNALVAGSKLFFKCKKGFLLIGKDKIKCQKNGLWTHDPPSCAAIISRKKTKNTKKTIRCPMPEPVFNGAVTASRMVSSTASYRCIKGYEIVGPRERKCLPSGKWAGTSPKCVKLSCPDPGVPENGRRAGSKFEYGNRVRYSCLSGYALSGSAVRKCKKNQRWSGLPAVCRVTSCPDPGVPENGRRAGNKFEYGNRVRYSCLSGYSLSGSPVRECKENQRWSGLPAVCRDYSKCGQGGVMSRGRIMGGTISRSINGTPWPWQVAIYRFNIKHYNFVCSGSLISNNLILTAAQCTYEFRRHPYRYRVVVGELKIIHEPNDLWLENKAHGVKRVHVHEEFSPSDFSGSNDIAILELRSPVKWSANVQSVCLPEQHHNIEEKFYGYVTGWGNTANIAKGERLKKSEDLRYVFLPVQSNKTCKLDDARKNKMFCAGDGKGEKDACRGDSGAPFVVKLPDDEKETKFSFKIMGIVSHGPECGTKNEYGFYTRVTNYLGWIKKFINEIKKDT